MILKYGSYAHANNEARIAIRKEAIRAKTGVYYAHRETWSITGLLQADSQAALSTGLDALQTAYSVSGNDIVLYFDDGVTPTTHAILSRNTMGGVMVVHPPEFPVGTGAEYSTFRTYSIVLQADVPVVSNNILLSWCENLDFTGTGGPLRRYQPVARGRWPRQRTTDASVYRVHQSGSAVGLTGYPAPPSPIWPQQELLELRRIKLRGPRWRRERPFEFPIEWSYTFESGDPLVGNPSALPG